MKRSFLFLIIFVSLPFPIITQAQDFEFYHRTHLFVMFKPGVITLPSGSNQAQPSAIANLPAWLDSLAASTGMQTIAKSDPAFAPGDTITIRSDGKRIKSLDFSRIFLLIFSDGVNLDSIANYLDNQNDVIFVDRLPKVEADFSPNDTNFDKQWALHPDTAADKGIYAEGAWDFFRGDSTVKIGIMDSGVRKSHEDFGSKAAGDDDIGGNGFSPGHGTQVAGIAAAIGNNGTGVAGVDWGAKIYSKNLGVPIDSIMWQLMKISKAVKEAVDSGCAVLNNSWGFFRDKNLEDPVDTVDTTIIIRSAFAYAYNNDVVSVASMGNQTADSVKYPAACDGVIAVGATLRDGSKAPYSNWGNHIDVVAPGGMATISDTHDVIYTTKGSSDAAYGYFSHTSAAAPHVSGLAVLLKGYRPTLHNDDIENIIELSAKDLELAGWDKRTGWGRINAKAAFDLIRPPNWIASLTSTGGGDIVESVTTAYQFYAVEGLQDGEYYDATRYKVVKSVGYDGPYWATPKVWGVGYTTTGFSNKYPNFGLGWDTATAVTINGCMLETYVYQIRTDTDTFYVPAHPNSVTFGYTVLGERVLSAATDFNATSDTGPPNRIVTSWKDCNVNEEAFIVKRKASDSASFNIIANLPPFNPPVCVSPVDSFLDTNIIGSETYTYKLEVWTRHQPNVHTTEKTATSFPRWPRNLTATVASYPCGGEELAMMESIELVETEAAAPDPNCYSNIVLLKWRPPSNQKANTISEYKIHAVSTDSEHVKWISVPYPETSHYFCMCYGKTYDFWVHTKDIFAAQSIASNKVTRTGTSTYICGDHHVCHGGPPQARIETPDADVNDENRGKPTEFSLSQNYPNPFNLSTQIKYDLPKDGYVQIEIYNILGQKIKVFDLGYQATGYKSVFWDGRNQNGEEVSSGLYLYRIKAGEFLETKRMTLLK